MLSNEKNDLNVCFKVLNHIHRSILYDPTYRPASTISDTITRTVETLLLPHEKTFAVQRFLLSVDTSDENLKNIVKRGLDKIQKTMRDMMKE